MQAAGKWGLSDVELSRLAERLLNLQIGLIEGYSSAPLYAARPNPLSPLAHLLLLDRPHLVDNPLKDALERFRRQRPWIVGW